MTDTDPRIIEFYKYCMDEVKVGSNYSARIRLSGAFKELATEYENLEEVIELAAKKVGHIPTLEERFKEGIDKALERPFLPVDERLPEDEKAEMILFRMRVNGYGDAMNNYIFKHSRKDARDRIKEAMAAKELEKCS